jgi:phosphoribosylaminoimidazole-succinocarboxamide synthase
MSKVPISMSRQFVSGLTMISRGKVRDTYALANDALLLPVTTDRVSIFDFVLPAEVPQKGEVLTALNIFWLLALGRKLAPYSQDVVAFGSGIDYYLPQRLQGNAKLQKRAMVVRKLQMVPVEAIVRGYLTGSGWNAYTKTAPDHMVCGHRIPEGLKDGDRLPSPLFTPTTKAAEGHDEYVSAEEVTARYGPRIETIALELFEAASKIALERGIILADTKLEFGVDPALANIDPAMQRFVLGDERFTPDSSRFWLLDDWKRSREKGTSPTSFDKQFVREWGKTVGIHKLDPLRSEDVAQVHGLTVPQDILAGTARLYRYIFYLITGMRLETFQRSQMNIPASLPSVEIVLGSESDLPQIEGGFGVLRRNNVHFRVHVISCHRNPDTLRQYAALMVPPDATVIAAAGKAAALPGMLQAWLQYYGHGHIPVIGVALNGNEDSDLTAARLSIERLPGTPVILEAKDKAYAGREGFALACRNACVMEFFVPRRSPKEPKFNLFNA